jgi:hypothetical protein
MTRDAIDRQVAAAQRCIRRHLITCPPEQLPPVAGLQPVHINNLARHLVMILARPGLPKTRPQTIPAPSGSCARTAPRSP